MLSIIARLSFTPYDVRFADLLDSFAQQDRIVQSETRIMHLEISITQTVAQEKTLEMRLAELSMIGQSSQSEQLEGVEQNHVMKDSRIFKDDSTEQLEAMLKDGEGPEVVQKKREIELKHFEKRSARAEEALRRQALEYIEGHDTRPKKNEEGLSQRSI